MTDGELVVADSNGRSDFEEVRRRNLLQRPRMIADAATRRPLRAQMKRTATTLTLWARPQMVRKHGPNLAVLMRRLAGL